MTGHRDEGLALGIDFGGTGIKGALVNTRSGSLEADRHRIPTPDPATPETVAETVAELVRHFDWRGPVGCTVPGRVRNGVVETAANIDEAWIGTDAASLFAAATGMRAAVLNDADAAGLAELRFGAGANERGTLLVLTFGTGIGSALFRDGRMVPNAELGHIELGGKTIERWASNAARKKSDLSWKEWAGRVQKILDHLEFVLSPDLIVIGGGVSRPHRWERFGDLLRTRCRLERARLENEAGLVGAACAAVES